ncbi:acyl-CoA thioester hydrolase YciA [Buchnera aphidicola]|uniref:acyl-CoA thioester hydrolase YciA n=1 Tax=Buchnera aphidicola TaxID=9 RepID=UPI003463FB28
MIDKNKNNKKKMVLRTLAMPANINVNGNIFGGWIMSQMDLGGAILAKEIAKGKVTTLKIENMIFLKKIIIGDLVSCYANCVSIGRTSMKVKVEMWIKKISSEPFGDYFKTAKATFIYVAIDQDGNPRSILNHSIS